MHEINMKLWSVFIVFILHMLYGCAGKPAGDGSDGTIIDFGDPEMVSSSDIINDYAYVKLDDSEHSLVGEICQLECFRDRIYILDTYKTGTIFVFSKTGALLSKLEKKGDGPGEFISPHSFKIDPRGYLYVLDRMLNRLLKYRLDDLMFVEEITLPAPAPVSFSTIPDGSLFVYYYPARRESPLENKQVVFADKYGKIVSLLYDAPLSSKVLHGDASNIYSYDGKLRIYPFFADEVYEVSTDSLAGCYRFLWGKYTVPDESLFNKYEDSGDIMKELSIGEKDWIRLMYVYEIEQSLWVKYYIKNDFYLSGWNKSTGDVFNAKHEDIVDDLGMGGCFPLPVGTSGEQMVGTLYSSEIEMDKVTDEKLKSLLEGMTEESNPILVFYTLK